MDAIIDKIILIGAVIAGAVAYHYGTRSAFLLQNKFHAVKPKNQKATDGDKRVNDEDNWDDN